MDSLLSNGYFYLGTAAVLIFLLPQMAHYWWKIRKAEAQASLAEMEATLKLEMVQRGMTADEIEKVLQAGVSRATAEEAHTCGDLKKTVGYVQPEPKT